MSIIGGSDGPTSDVKNELREYLSWRWSHL